MSIKIFIFRIASKKFPCVQDEEELTTRGKEAKKTKFVSKEAAAILEESRAGCSMSAREKREVIRALTQKKNQSSQG